MVRGVIASVVLLLSLGLLGLGVLLSNTHGAAQVATNARQLHWTNATLGASGIARAAVAQAVFFSYEDVSDPEGSQRAVDEAQESLGVVSRLADSPEAPGEAALNLVAQYVSAASEAISLAESGESTEAETVRLAAVEPAYETLRDELSTRQAELAQLVTDTEREAGRISRITFVSISFLIPGITMIVFWFLLRRRVRHRETEMKAQITAHKELNQAKDEFIGGLSHELRTPLTSIVGFSELLLDNGSLDTDAKEQLTLIHSSSSDLARMVEDLLLAARIDAGALSVSPRQLDLAEQVSIAVSSYVLAGETVELRVPSIQVYADTLHVRQIVHNLVSNAVRHGGDRILVSAAEQGSSAALVVADNGPGVSHEVEQRMFRRFVHDGKQALVAGSVGLGLAISRELAIRMHGELRYGRTDGWTTFTLLIPNVPARRDADIQEMVSVDQ